MNLLTVQCEAPSNPTLRPLHCFDQHNFFGPNIKQQECKNTEVVWELRKTGFVKAVVSRAVWLQGCPLG